MLQIRLFGKPQVICDGTDITPELGNKGCALLCILFLRGGDYYAREKLAAYLWPDSAVSSSLLAFGRLRMLRSTAFSIPE